MFAVILCAGIVVICIVAAFSRATGEEMNGYEIAAGFIGGVMFWIGIVGLAVTHVSISVH